MRQSRKEIVLSGIYEDISMLGDGYRRFFKNVFSFFFFVLKKIFQPAIAIPRCVIRHMGVFLKELGLTLYHEGKKFVAEVKRATPTISAKFKENPLQGIRIFFYYVGRALKNHEKFTKAVLNTVIPVVALVFVLSFAFSFRAVTFALNVTVNGKSVGVVENEAVYKEAQAKAEKRFFQSGETVEFSLPEYTVALALKGSIDDTETVCNNIISALCENTVSACGIYADDEFICAVKSEDTFNRVADEILNEYAKENGYTSDDYTVEFNAEIKVVPGIYPENDRIWSAQQLKSYLIGEKDERIEYTVTKDDTLSAILDKFDITEDELKSLNKDLNTSNIPEGSVLLIKRGCRNIDIKTTVTYTVIETSDFDTVVQYDNNFYAGTSMTIIEGKQGMDVVSYTDIYVNGVISESSKEIVRYNASAPINELIKIGTLGVPVGNDDSPVSPRLLKDQGGTFIWPAPDNCFWLSQAYNPSNGHYGIDIVSSDNGSCKGRPIVSVADGVVVLATYHWSWGYYIRVDHGDGVVTGYAHALKGSFKVNVGDYVRAGQQLSSIGTTGNSTGYHLHFEVWLDGKRVDPLPYVYSQYTGITVGK